MIVGLTASRYWRRWRALFSSVMSAQAPTSSKGWPASSRITLKELLDPNVVPVAMAEAVGDRPAPLLYQRHNLGEHTRGVFRMQQLGPALRIGRHLLRRATP